MEFTKAIGAIMIAFFALECALGFDLHGRNNNGGHLGSNNLKAQHNNPIHNNNRHQFARAIDAKKEGSNSANQNAQGQPDWKPVTGTREFSVNVADNIEGSNVQRHEKWDNGTVTGSYAAPGRNGKWLKYEYIGDKNGFRITSTKEVDADQLMDGNAAAKDNEANININSNSAPPVKYTVTEEQLAKAKENQKKLDANQKSQDKH